MLGTGGAIKKATKEINGYFFLTYGDSYLPINYQNLYNFFCKKNSSIMTVLKNNNKWDSSNTSFNKEYILSYSKKVNSNYEYIDYGLMILNQSNFKCITKKKFDLTEIICDLISKKKLLGYEVDQRFYEIGSFDGIIELEKYLNQN